MVGSPPARPDRQSQASPVHRCPIQMLRRSGSLQCTFVWTLSPYVVTTNALLSTIVITDPDHHRASAARSPRHPDIRVRFPRSQFVVLLWSPKHPDRACDSNPESIFPCCEAPPSTHLPSLLSQTASIFSSTPAALIVGRCIVRSHMLLSTSICTSSFRHHV